MTNDITLKGKVYNWQFSTEAGSQRKSITDGATLPHTIKIAHSDATDSATKLPIKRSLFRVDMTHVDTGGVNPAPVPVSAYLVVQHGTGLYQPTTAAIELAVDTVVQAMTGTGADASALDLADEIFAGKQQ
jgi:hypothetical protein